MKKFTVPLYITQVYKSKKKKNKNISLTMNWYRNVHFIVNNKMKIQFKELIEDQLQ